MELSKYYIMYASNQYTIWCVGGRKKIYYVERDVVVRKYVIFVTLFELL